MLFYFTATGNSLYATRAIEPDPISIPQIWHSAQRDFTADAIGIVAPVYGHELPPMVQQFIRQSTFHTDYFYLVLTYGNRHGGAAELAEQLCRACGIAPSYINVLLMVDNWLPAFDMEEERKKDKQVDAHLAQIAADIADRRRFIAPVSEEDRAAHQSFLAYQSQAPADAWQHLIRMGEQCTGCGICQQVCPSGSIRLEQGRAVHHPGNCQACLACVHHCPVRAIGLSLPEKNPNARYRNEHIALSDIIAANRQQPQ